MASFIIVFFMLVIASVVDADYQLVANSSRCAIPGNDPCMDAALSNLTSNTTLLLQEGKHYLSQTSVVSSLSNITITGMGGSVLLTCRNNSGLIFSDVQELTIAGLRVTLCGASGQVVANVANELHNLGAQFNSTAFYSLIIMKGSVVTLEDVTIDGSKGLGLLLVNAMGSLSLFNVVVSGNHGGGAFILYSASDSTTSVQVEIINCNFSNNHVIDLRSPITYSGDYLPLTSTGGGMTVILASSVEFTMWGSVIESNAAQYGGGVFLGMFTGLHDSSVCIIDCIFQYNCLDCTFNYGGGLYLALGLPQPAIIGQSKNVTLSIRNSSFSYNKAFDGGGIYLVLLQPITLTSIQSSLFDLNTAAIASAIAVHSSFSLNYRPPLASLSNNTIKSNKRVFGPSKFASAVSIQTGVIILEENNFLSNEVSGLSCLACAVHVKGENVFYNNTGVNGGALHLVNGQLVMYNNSLLSLHKNTATVSGGAIYTEPNSDYEELDHCFILLANNVDFSGCSFGGNFHTLVDFRGNYAPISSMIHGSSLKPCAWIVDTRSTNIFEHLYAACNNSELFYFDEKPTGTSKISSPSEKFVLSKTNYTVIPGAEVCASMTAYDIFNQAIEDIIAFRILPSGDGLATLANSRVLQSIGIGAECVPLTISGAQNSTVEIEVWSIAPSSQASATLSIHLGECSVGHNYNESSGTCDCDERFALTGIKCTSYVFSIPSGLWLGRGRDDFKDVLLWGHCPRGYCRTHSIVNITSDFFFQCSEGSGRTGLLCGSCQPGLSVVLGSSKDCHQCSNSYLAMLIVIMFLGMVIIVFLAFSHISIAEGYLNSVFFYCNVISIYAGLFVPAMESEWRVLYIVADLLSLHFNFNTCIYNSMTEFAVLLIQYLFVAYIFLLMGILYLIASRYSVPGAYSFSPIKTTVTLLLLCYMSLIDACTKSLSFARVYTLDGNLVSVLWRGDTELTYFTSVHSVLVVLAVLVILFLLLPFTAIVVYPRCTYKISFLAKLKPLYDAVWAPFRPEARWWFGVRLILRWLLYILAATLETDQSIFALELVLLVLLFVQSMLKPFITGSANHLDNSLLVLVLALAMGVSIRDKNSFLATYNIILTLFFYSALFIVFATHFRERFPQFLSDTKRFYSVLRRKCCSSRRYNLLEEEVEASVPEISSTEVSIAGLREDANLKETEIVTTAGHVAANVLPMTEQHPSLATVVREVPVTTECHSDDDGDTRFYTCRDRSSQTPDEENQ